MCALWVVVLVVWQRCLRWSNRTPWIISLRVNGSVLSVQHKDIVNDVPRFVSLIQITGWIHGTKDSKLWGLNGYVHLQEHIQISLIRIVYWHLHIKKIVIMNFWNLELSIQNWHRCQKLAAAFGTYPPMRFSKIFVQILPLAFLTHLFMKKWLQFLVMMEISQWKCWTRVWMWRM